MGKRVCKKNVAGALYSRKVDPEVNGVSSESECDLVGSDSARRT